VTGLLCRKIGGTGSWNVKDAAMPGWEYVTITVIYGRGERVDSVSYNSKTIFILVKWSVVLRYLEHLKDQGWELITVSPMGWGEMYKFKRSEE